VLGLTDDVWSEAIGVGPLDVRVTREQWQALQAADLPLRILIDDVQALIAAQRQGGLRDGGPFDDYMDYDQVLAYLDELVELRPDLAQSFVVGQSLEGRDIVGIRVRGPGDGNRPAILYHGCQHAREWITVPVTLYIADQLIRNYDSDPGITRLVDRADWYLVPVFNPDGYVYTWDEDRLWRKNRRKNDDGSYGVDNNRNWGYEWGHDNGSSGNPNSQTYRGKSAFSEPETKAMADFIEAHPEMVAFCDIHNYSQLIMWPWGYTDDLPPDQAEYLTIGENMAELVHGVHGLTYEYGPIYTTIYPVSGGSVDWVYGDQGINAFTYELRDTGEYGFLLPAEQILPTCEEVFPALKFYAEFRSAAVRITFPDDLPEYLPPGQKNTMRVQIDPGSDEVDPEGAALFVRKSSDEEFEEFPLQQSRDGTFAATFPARSCGPPTQFYIVAHGKSGAEERSPTGAPDEYYSAPVGTPQVVLNDNFQDDLGWTVENQEVSFGAWTRVDPNGTYRRGQPVQPEDDNPSGSGTQCYVTGQGQPGGDASVSDLDGGPTILISPKLDLTGLTNPRIRFYRWVYSTSQDFEGADSLFVDVSSDDGATWVTVKEIEHENAWRSDGFDVADFIEPNDTVRVRFRIADNPNNAVTEGAVDDVVVDGLTCANVPLPGDMNCDGDVNFDDIDGFVLALTSREQYEAQYPDCDYLNADVNQDGSVDFDDIDPFVELLL
jgi:murein tripeptide amidase MpaA